MLINYAPKNLLEYKKLDIWWLHFVDHSVLGVNTQPAIKLKKKYIRIFKEQIILCNLCIGILFGKHTCIAATIQ